MCLCGKKGLVTWFLHRSYFTVEIHIVTVAFHAPGCCLSSRGNMKVLEWACYRTHRRQMVLFLILLKRINCRHTVMICLPANRTMIKSTTSLGPLLLYFRYPVVCGVGQTKVASAFGHCFCIFDLHKFWIYAFIGLSTHLRITMTDL